MLTKAQLCCMVSPPQTNSCRRKWLKLRVHFVWGFIWGFVWGLVLFGFVWFCFSFKSVSGQQDRWAGKGTSHHTDNLTSMPETHTVEKGIASHKISYDLRSLLWHTCTCAHSHEKTINKQPLYELWSDCSCYCPLAKATARREDSEPKILSHWAWPLNFGIPKEGCSCFNLSCACTDVCNL